MMAYETKISWPTNAPDSEGPRQDRTITELDEPMKPFKIPFCNGWILDKRHPEYDRMRDEIMNRSIIM